MLDFVTKLVLSSSGQLPGGGLVFFRTHDLSLVTASLLVFSAYSNAQSSQSAPAIPPQNQKNEDVVVLSGIATTARIADPNEKVVFNGHVMRMADFVAAVSSSSEVLQRLRTPEKRNRETDQPIPPLKPSD